MVRKAQNIRTRWRGLSRECVGVEALRRNVRRRRRRGLDLVLLTYTRHAHVTPC
jgi:hypothetical protein